MYKFIKDISYYCLEKGGVIRMHIGVHQAYVIADPDDYMTVANACLGKPYILYSFAKKWLGNGLLTADENTWKVHRKLLSPAFSQKILNLFLDVFNNQSRGLVDQLKDQVGRGPFNPEQHLLQNILETTCRAALNINPEENNLCCVDYFTATKHLMDILVERFQKFWLHPQFMFDLSSLKKKHDEYCKFIAGVVSTMNVFICRLQEVLGDTDVDVDRHALTKLVYMEAVLKESIRLYSPIPVVARIAHGDVKLKNYTMPAGSICVLSIYGLHRHAMWGADAEQFRPERWLQPGGVPDHPNAFAGFSLGRRNCIGKLYGLMSMKTTLAHLLRRHHVTADASKLILNWNSVMRPVSGHDISLKLRMQLK